MKSWSLQWQFAFLASALTAIALSVAALALLPFVHARQLKDLDERLSEDAKEILDNLPPDGSKPKPNFIPVALRLRYVELEGADGTMRYRSGNLRRTDLQAEPGTARTLTLFERQARVVTRRQGPWTVHLGTRLGTLEKMQRDLRAGFLIAIPTAALAVLLAGLWLGRRAIRPVTLLTDAAERIGVDRPTERLPMPAARDEIARLTKVLNDAFDRLQRSYESAARFSADASHQLKTPVSVLRSGLETLRGNASLSAEDREEVDALLRQTRRLSTLIDDLLLLAQADAKRLGLETSEINLANLLDTAWDDLEVMAETRGLLLERDWPASLPCHADPRRLGLILQNLTENALKYTPAGGKIRLSASATAKETCVVVANTGPPIPEAERGQIFERFHRGVAENVAGHGLGLSIAREIARAHGGDLTLEQTDDWTRFVLALPLSNSAKPKSNRH